MGSKKRKRLEATVAAIQRRWGRRALQRGAPGPAVVPHIPTGFAALDEALDGSGGIPRRRISELLGAPTSGMTTLALKLIEQAQRGGDLAAYLDLAHTFDPDYAARCGVDLQRLLLIRPQTGLEMLEFLYHLLHQSAAGLLVVDATPDLINLSPDPAALAAGLPHLLPPLAQSPAALLFLTPLRFGGPMSMANYPPNFALPHLASLRLELRKERWLTRGRDVRGYQARVRVIKNKLGRAGQQASIAITFNGTVRGDAT